MNRTVLEGITITGEQETVNLADAIFLLNHLFQGGGAPPGLFASCGIDPVPDKLSRPGHACDARGAVP